MSRPRRITIKEIAAEAGVSMQTVSRVLNNRPDVAIDTRRRIKEIIALHNYLPSSAARGITHGRSYTLGVISSTLHYYGPAALVMGVEKYASRLGYTIVLRVAHDLAHINIDEHLNFFQSQHVDGIVWTLPAVDNLDATVIERTTQLQIPIIFFNMHPHPGMTILDFDHWRGSSKAVSHLLDQGAQKVGIITGPMTWLAAQQRYQGWYETLTTAGHRITDDLVAEGDWTPDSGEHALRRLLTQRPDIDAVYISNDHMAMGAMKAARLLGRHIPDDLLLVGYDNIPETEYFHPSLTTIACDADHLTSVAISKLDQMIANTKRDEQWLHTDVQLIEPELIIRESSCKRGT